LVAVFEIGFVLTGRTGEAASAVLADDVVAELVALAVAAGAELLEHPASAPMLTRATTGKVRYVIFFMLFDFP
jgi:hypothetical protein